MSDMHLHIHIPAGTELVFDGQTLTCKPAAALAEISGPSAEWIKQQLHELGRDPASALNSDEAQFHESVEKEGAV